MSTYYQIVKLHLLYFFNKGSTMLNLTLALAESVHLQAVRYLVNASISTCSQDIIYLCIPQTGHKDGRHDISPKVKPKHPDRPLMAGCSICHKARPPSISVDGTWVKLNSQSTPQMNFSQIWFLSFQVVVIMLMFVQVFLFLISLVLIRG